MAGGINKALRTCILLAILCLSCRTELGTEAEEGFPTLDFGLLNSDFRLACSDNKYVILLSTLVIMSFLSNDL